eukprot:g50493.t1
MFRRALLAVVALRCSLAAETDYNGAVFTELESQGRHLHPDYWPGLQADLQTICDHTLLDATSTTDATHDTKLQFLSQSFQKRTRHLLRLRVPQQNMNFSSILANAARAIVCYSHTEAGCENRIFGSPEIPRISLSDQGMGHGRTVSLSYGFMHFIEENYDWLPPYLVFLHGGSSQWHEDNGALNLAMSSQPKDVFTLTQAIYSGFHHWKDENWPGLFSPGNMNIAGCMSVFLMNYSFGLNATEYITKDRKSRTFCCEEAVINRDVITRWPKSAFQKMSCLINHSPGLMWALGRLSDVHGLSCVSAEK